MLYVDDIVIVSNNMLEVDKVKVKLNNEVNEIF